VQRFLRSPHFLGWELEFLDRSRLLLPLEEDDFLPLPPFPEDRLLLELFLSRLLLRDLDRLEEELEEEDRLDFPLLVLVLFFRLLLLDPDELELLEELDDRDLRLDRFLSSLDLERLDRLLDRDRDDFLFPES